MAETLINDFATTLTEALAINGTTLKVGTTAPTYAHGKRTRLRVGQEFILATITDGMEWPVVTREVEDATRYPKSAHPAGESVIPVLTADGVQQLIEEAEATASYMIMTGDGDGNWLDWNYNDTDYLRTYYDSDAHEWVFRTEGTHNPNFRIRSAGVTSISLRNCGLITKMITLQWWSTTPGRATQPSISPAGTCTCKAV